MTVSRNKREGWLMLQFGRETYRTNNKWLSLRYQNNMQRYLKSHIDNSDVNLSYPNVVDWDATQTIIKALFLKDNNV